MDLKNLEAMIKLCKKHGVTEVTCDGISLKLDISHPAVKRGRKRKSIENADEFLTENQMTEEQLLSWSSMPIGQ